jgi:hypothetical protein
MDPDDNSTANNDTGIPDRYIEVPAPNLEVEDVRPVDEQGDADFWGIPEALTQHIFQFLTNKKLCPYGGFPKAQNAPSRTPGDCFSMPIRSDWGRYTGKSPEVCFWEYIVND